jgi:hypothetical protein
MDQCGIPYSDEYRYHFESINIGYITPTGEEKAGKKIHG